MNVFAHAYMWPCRCTYIHIWTQKCMCTCELKQIYACAHVCLYACIYVVWGPRPFKVLSDVKTINKGHNGYLQGAWLPQCYSAPHMLLISSNDMAHVLLLNKFTYSMQMSQGNQTCWTPSIIKIMHFLNGLRDHFSFIYPNWCALLEKHFKAVSRTSTIGGFSLLRTSNKCGRSFRPW